MKSISKHLVCGWFALLAAIAIAHGTEKADDPSPADNPKPGEVREFEIAHGVKMQFCWIPAGKATLGSPKTEKERQPINASEKEQPFQTQGFWLGKFEVTQAQYEAVMGTNPSYFSKHGSRADYRERVKGLDTSDLPVENVSWNDARRFIEKCTKKALRLPHEHEWEYAYRGGLGNQQPFYWGNTLDGNKANCNGLVPYGPDKIGKFLERPTKVGSFERAAPHPWGLCDMSGNVWEWCEWDEPPPYKPMRGGCWGSNGVYCRAAQREAFRADHKGQCVGFRLCADPAK